MLQWKWLAVLGCCDGWLLFLLLLLGIEEWVRETLTRQERGKRKKYKMINRRVIVTVHICKVTVVIVHKYIILHPLMWVFFCSKCVKWAIFSILQDFTHTDANALIWLLYPQQTMTNAVRKFPLIASATIPSRIRI